MQERGLRRYYRAYAIAEFIAEGHTIQQVKDEFRVSKGTIEGDLTLLSQSGYGKDLEKNLKMYRKAKMQLCKNIGTKGK